MGKNEEKADVVAVNPLVESGVEKMIQVIRGKQVLLDRDLASLYGVETKYINRAVKRNPKRFPGEFYFELTKEEFLRCQIGTLVGGRGKHSKYSTFAFTEQGVAMLSAVLHSETAIMVSIKIMQAFVAMRHFMMGNGGIVNRLSNIESKDFYNNQEFDAYVFVCNLIRQAKKRIVLVDRYVTEKTLTMMLKREKGVSVTIYTYDKSKVLEMDLTTYNEQYPDSPMRVLPSYGMHDTLEEVLKESQKSIYKG